MEVLLNKIINLLEQATALANSPTVNLFLLAFILAEIAAIIYLIKN